MSSNIKVLQVIPKLGYGGAETGCYDIAHYLPENNCKSFIVTSGGELTKFVDKKVKLIKLPVHSKNPLLILINTILLIGIILFFKIKSRKYFKSYMKKENTNIEEEKKIIQKIIKEELFNGPEIFDYLENKSIYWNDDLFAVQILLSKIYFPECPLACLTIDPCKFTGLNSRTGLSLPCLVVL